MTILRPPSRPPSAGFRQGDNWFLWAVVGVVLLLVLLVVIVKSMLGSRSEGTVVTSPEAKHAAARQESQEIAPGVRYEILIPAQEGQKSKKDKAEAPSAKTGDSRTDAGKAEPSAGKTEPAKKKP